ncbi:MAG: DUF262 domain-containing protein [Sandaracinaceae bacterium]|nr:DUF262 domain-containing protein [Sandaracinaceae bacterium]
MAIRESLQTNALAFGELLVNGRRYRVPPFQRSYSWSQSQWDDLWDDLCAAERARTDHYLGALVLKRTDEPDTYDVIDGQQQLATLSILALALVRALESWAEDGVDPEANRERATLLRERLIASRDPASLMHRSRLQLNQFDDRFYQSALVNGAAPANPRRLPKSERALWDAWTYFQDRVTARFGPSKSGNELATFADRVLARRLVFIEIVVDDEAAAYTVFETLNARGVALGTADLLKNFLFAKAASGGKADLDEMGRRWDRLVDAVPLEELADLAHHWANTQSHDVHKRHVFRRVRETVTDKASAFAYVDALLAAANWYAALLDPHDEAWVDHPETRPWVRVLVMLKAEQYRPLALAAAPRWARQPADMERLFRMIAIFTLRANVVLRVNTGDVFRAWNRAAVAVVSGSATTVSEIAQRARAIYGDDDAFEAAFAELTLAARGPRKKLVRYLLAQLEEDARGLPIDWETDGFTIEHVLPASGGEAWTHVSEEDRERFASRLGNYVPLEASLNRELSDAPFADKLAGYARSGYALPRQITGDSWGPEHIRARAARYAKRARHLFRVDF